MDLPAPLRQAVEVLFEGVPLARIAEAAAALSSAYRGERFEAAVGDEVAGLAYLATRLPATYAAMRAALREAALALPGFAPRSLADVGAGPGTALFAARDCFPEIGSAILVERNPVMRRLGARLAAGLAGVAWRAGDLTSLAEAGTFDLVTLGYVLGELPSGSRRAAVERLWTMAGGVLVLVEPGTPAGWQRVLEARAALVAAGAHIAAPCPHARQCPLALPDWCHFAERLPRSRLHRVAKGGEVPWEDEKFIYLVASRLPGEAGGARVIAPPRAASGRTTLKLCRADGTAGERLFSRREGDLYRMARRAEWGDRLPQAQKT
jgi:ribosomal protein RSM22 (predicted rRNA methylase)